MKLARFWDGEKVQAGIITGEEVAELRGSIYGGYELTGRHFPFREMSLLAPCEPTKVVCVGLNYRDHAEELHLDIPVEPVLFLKPPSSVIGHRQPICKPKICRRLDHEAELAVVIKEVTRSVSPTEAKDKILGYTCANDVTARDLQPKTGQWTLAKSFDTFCPLGPFIVTDVDPTNLEVSLFLNGSIRQKSSTHQMIFPVYDLVSYISRVMTLFPGDVILTGTPGGIGCMEPGDEVIVEISGVGRLINEIIEG